MTPTLVGVISDTHGLLRPEAIDALRDVDLIIHAGDIGEPEVIGALERIAPVFAVRGNMDSGAWSLGLPDTDVVEAGDNLLYVLHDVHELDLDPAASGFSAVIFGHSHCFSVEKRKGVLYLNPGSAGPRRSDKPVTLALLRIQENSLDVQKIEL